MKKKILIIVLAVLFIAYISSYLLIRQSHEQIHEIDGCPVGGCVEIEFPHEGFYNIYQPLIGLDSILLGTKFTYHGNK